MIKRQPANQRSHAHCGEDTDDQSQQRPAGTEAVMAEHQCAGISTNAKECRLAESQDAGIAPQQIDRQRQRGIQQRANQNIDGVNIQHIGRKPHH